MLRRPNTTRSFPKVTGQATSMKAEVVDQGSVGKGRRCTCISLVNLQPRKIAQKPTRRHGQKPSVHL